KILNSDIIHLRRPDGRSWDGFMHVNPGLEEKALVMLFNPTAKTIEETLKLPLYFTGLKDEVFIKEKGESVTTSKLNRNYETEIRVSLPANGYTWLVVK
ncbi:MAG: alpha-galactosidase, partial [Maribacter sp.]|nr:alpha-galactosidase [Maribacter sp.]